MRRQSVRTSNTTASAGGIFSQSSFAAQPAGSGSQPPLSVSLNAASSATQPTMAPPTPSSGASSTATGMGSGVPHRQSLSGYKTLRTLRSTMDPSLYSPTDPAAPLGSDRPEHLKNNVPEASTTRAQKEEPSIIKSKEDQEEEEKLRQKEKTMSWDDKRKAEDHCILVREEVLSTEQTYVENLVKIKNAYIDPLERVPEDKLMEDVGITAVQRAALLSNLAVIIGFQQKFHEDLKAKGPRHIEEVIIQYSHFFRLYSKYATDYQTMAETLTALAPSKKWQAFTTIVDHRLAGPNSNGAEQLQSYLILPIQRIPRYELLLRELKRSTLPSLPEFETITKALGLIKQTATHVNTAKKEAESMAVLLDLQRKIKGDLSKDLQIVQPHRRHLRTATVQLCEPHKKSLFGTMKVNTRIVYLFNDVMVWTNVENEYKAFFNIASISSIEDVAGTDYILEISSSSKFLQFNFCTDKVVPAPDSARGLEIKAMKDAWREEVHKLMEENQAARRRQRSFRQRDDSRTQAHRLIVGKFTTLDRKQMEDLKNQQEQGGQETSRQDGIAE